MQIIWLEAVHSKPLARRGILSSKIESGPSGHLTPFRGGHLATIAQGNNNAYMHKLGCVARWGLSPIVTRSGSWFCSLVLLFAPAVLPAQTIESQKKAARTLTFERDIRPILRVHCLDCHGNQNVRKGALDMRLRRLMVKGGESGPALSPGHPEESYLLDRVKAGEMPPGDQKLSSAEIAVLETWIREGARTAQKEPAEITAATLITAVDRDFWCFRPIRRPPIPRFAPSDRIR